MTDAQKSHEYEMTGAQKIDAYKMTGAQKIDAYKMTGAQKKKIDAYELTDAQKQKTDVYELMDSQKKIDEYKMTGAQKSHEYELTDAQNQKADVYELMDSQKKIDAYKMTGAQKIREYELTGAQNQKADVYRLMDSQKTREYNLTGAQKTDENSSCVKVRKNDGVEIIHECQRKRACRDVDVKPVVQDPMDDDRVLVESGTEMTPVPCEPSRVRKTETQSHSHPISTMVHIARLLISCRKLHLSPSEHCPFASHCQQSPRFLCSRCFTL